MKKLILITLGIALFAISASHLFAQDKSISVETEVTLESKVLGESRTLQIHLPQDYENGSKNYPVLYLLDGRTHIKHGSAATDYLSGAGMIPEMIVVAITNVDRTRDFSPSHVPERPTTGGAPNFLTFLETELIPYVNDNYRAASFRILMGHSFGGTFATYALCTKPELFNGFIAVSPYLMYDDNSMVKLAEKSLGNTYETNKAFYMTVGDEPNYFDALDTFAEYMKTKAGQSISFQYDKMPAENHATIPYISVYNGLRFVFADWQLPQEVLNSGLQAIDAHYKTISAKYKYTVQTPENIINALGYRYLQNAEIEKAITVFLENTKRYPTSANVYDSLGEAYEKNNKKELAKTNYKKAYELGVANNSPNTNVYKQNFERVQ